MGTGRDVVVHIFARSAWYTLSRRLPQPKAHPHPRTHARTQEAMSLRREFAVDTLPPRPTAPIVSPDDEEEPPPRAYQEDG